MQVALSRQNVSGGLMYTSVGKDGRKAGLWFFPLQFQSVSVRLGWHCFSYVFIYCCDISCLRRKVSFGEGGAVFKLRLPKRTASLDR